jgi:GH15 family glucan-1,4-alpha-glucosidase
MSGLYLSRGLFPQEFLRPTVDFILGCQLDSGEWFEGGYTDPWDHTESAMGLAIGGELEAARRAYRWLAKMQLPDGSWWASYRGEEADNPRRRESNFVAYVATGVWHFYRLSGDREFLREMWPVVDRAIERQWRAETGCAGHRLQFDLQEPGVRTQYLGDHGTCPA